MRHLICWLAVGLFLMVSACAPYRLDKKEKPMQETEQIVALDVVLRNLNVVRHQSTKLEDGRLKIQLEVENEKRKDIWTDIQVVFKDTSGFDVERTSWQPFQFHRKTVTTYERISLNDKATDYRIIIRNIK